MDTLSSFLFLLFSNFMGFSAYALIPLNLLLLSITKIKTKRFFTQPWMALWAVLLFGLPLIFTAAIAYFLIFSEAFYAGGMVAVFLLPMGALQWSFLVMLLCNPVFIEGKRPLKILLAAVACIAFFYSVSLVLGLMFPLPS